MLLGVVTAGEWLYVATSARQPPEGFLVGLLSSLPFLLWLVYGGYWVWASDLSTDRYARVGAWTVGGLGTFLLMNVAIMVVLPPADVLVAVGWIRWAASIGGGVGLLVGIFEGRAVDRRIDVERTRARRQAIEQQNERLEEFASTVSHDLRNPLNVAFANLDRVRQERDSEHLDSAWDALERMNQIVDETLTLARSGRTVGDLEPVDLSRLATACWRNVDTAGASIEVGDLGRVEADPDRCRHLFENLYRNAIEHGGDDVSVRVGSLADGFFVEDDGPGVPTEERSEVLNAGYSTTDGGSGLGLAIVRQIVEAHGWEIRVAAGVDGGARFEVTGVDVVR